VTDHLRVPPCSVESEQAVLGGLMLKPSALESVAAVLSETDFYRRDHRVIWRAIEQLDAKGQPFDCVTMAEWFASEGVSDLVNPSYIIELTNTTPSAANVLAYARIVREKSMLRMLIDAGTELAGEAFDTSGDAQGLLDSWIVRLMGLQRQEARCEFTLKQAASLAWQDAAAAYERKGALAGITTGLIDLDEQLGGLHPGDLIVIGARPSMGKTAMLFGMSHAAAEAGFANGIISGEQPANQLGARMLSAASRVPGNAFRTGKFHEEHWPRLTRGIETLATLPIWILDRGSPSIAEVQRTARRWKQQHGIKALYVDYIQRLAGKGERRHEVIGETCRGLKSIARDLEIPVIALSQVNREVEKRRPPIPRMGDLSDSSEIEKEADAVITIYREDYYEPNTKKKGVAQLTVDKNRHGPTGFIEVTWRAETMTFENYASDARWLESVA
jgi:replicative DNA helicase